VQQTRREIAPYPVQDIKDDAHGDAKLLEVEVSIVIHIREVPYSLQLVISKSTVLENRGSLLACKKLAASCPRGKDVPVGFDFLRLDLGSHGCVYGLWTVSRCCS
jgi:hypothetical protein